VTSGAKVTEDASQIAEGLRSGKGVIGKLITDDELYLRAIAIARQTEETAANANQVVELAKNTLEGFQAKDGPLQEMTADFKLTLEGARAAMVGFAENMDALKHNFLLRGFFNGRGYFDLDDISPAAYRQGVLTKGGRQVARVWLRSDALFEPEPDAGEVERLTAAGKVHLDSAFAPSLEHAASGVVIVEGYAQQGPLEARFLRSRARASLVRDYLLARFFLDAQTTGAMPLGADSPGSPGLLPWDGVAIAVILPKGTITGKEGSKTGFSASPSHAD